MNGDDEPLPGGNDPDVSLLRPYLLTSGRAQPIDHTLELEAQVLTSLLGAASHPKLTFEHREIVSLCRTTKSVAEVAALLGLHIGVARVLVADLAGLGYVVLRRPDTRPSQDLDIIERVIRGLEAIR
jgi:hypothetical protein